MRVWIGRPCHRQAVSMATLTFKHFHLSTPTLGRFQPMKNRKGTLDLHRGPTGSRRTHGRGSLTQSRHRSSLSATEHRFVSRPLPSFPSFAAAMAVLASRRRLVPRSTLSRTSVDRRSDLNEDVRLPRIQEHRRQRAPRRRSQVRPRARLSGYDRACRRWRAHPPHRPPRCVPPHFPQSSFCRHPEPVLSRRPTMTTTRGGNRRARAMDRGDARRGGRFDARRRGGLGAAKGARAGWKGG